MDNYRPDGSVESSNSTNADNMHQNETSFDHNIYRCLVLNRITVDDNLNISRGNPSPEVMYRVIIIGGFNDGKIIDNARPKSMFGGPFNADEVVFRENTVKETQNLNTLTADGDIVYVTFVNGNIYDPIIIGSDKSPPLDRGATAARTADGQRWLWQFNSVRSLIDRTGKWIRTRFGGKVNPNTGALEPDSGSEVENSVQEIWEDGKITRSVSTDGVVETTEGVVEGNPVNKFTREFSSGLKLEQDGNGDVLERTFASGLSIKEDGANDTITILTVDEKTQAIINGNDGIVTISVEDGASILTMNKDGEITLTAQGVVNLDAPEVNVGDNSTLAATLFEKLKVAIDTHVHPIPGNMGPPATGVPVVPLIDIIGSVTVKVND